nr:nucleoside-triphosphatase [Methanosarcina siciliae]
MRKEGHREGFSIRDLATGKTGIFSRVKGSGPRLGKYHINLESLESVGGSAIRDALACDLVVIDEIGPMELISGSFVSAVEEVLESDKSILAVLHHSSRHPLAQRIRKGFELLKVDKDNRDELPGKISNRFLRELD